jgi:ATP-dependent DNA ligase
VNRRTDSAEWPFPPPITPMEAVVADDLPAPPGWGYEPKWDGFRALMWSRSGPSEPRLDSRNGKPLLRYFPELRPALENLPAGTVADGEVVVVTHGKLDFDALQNRIHPAESRILRLSGETPARLALFDLLAVAGQDLRARPLSERRQYLKELAGILEADAWLLSPQTLDIETARHWFVAFEPAGFDGIVAKGLDRPYSEGRREMVKVKHRRTVDCVIGGYRLHKDGARVGSILLGLYDARGELRFIGHCSSFTEKEARDLLAVLAPLAANAGGEAESGFGEHARRPGGLSRWSGDKDLEYEPVRPVKVVEISYDQLTGDRFRHGTRFERWRPDKDPRDCTMEQLERPVGPGVIEMLRSA